MLCDMIGPSVILDIFSFVVLTTVVFFILCVLLLAYFPIRRRDGDVMILLMMTYPLSRILIEFLRSDERVFLAGMTISQNISVVLVLAGCGFWFSQSRRPPRLYSETHAPTPEALAAAT